MVPSGLAARRISVKGLDTIPGATNSAADVIASGPGALAMGCVTNDGRAPPHATHASQMQLRMVPRYRASYRAGCCARKITECGRIRSAVEVDDGRMAVTVARV